MAAVHGDLVLDGVSGSGSPIRLEVQDPGGARTGRVLPTDHAAVMLHIPGVGDVEVSMVDAANPCVFVAAASMGISGTELPSDLEQDSDLLARLETIRRHASVRMGLAVTIEAAAHILGVPKVAMVAAPTDAPTLSARVLGADDADILVRMISLGQPHRAVPLTGALCLAAACRITGAIPTELLKSADGDIRIGHASGVVVVAAKAVRIGGATH